VAWLHPEICVITPIKIVGAGSVDSASCSIAFSGVYSNIGGRSHAECR